MKKSIISIGIAAMLALAGCAFGSETQTEDSASTSQASPQNNTDLSTALDPTMNSKVGNKDSAALSKDLSDIAGITLPSVLAGSMAESVCRARAAGVPRDEVVDALMEAWHEDWTTEQAGMFALMATLEYCPEFADA